MRISTTKCGPCRHPEFILEADKSQVPETYLRNVLQTIESMVASGSVFQPDQTFQIGWGMTLVQAAGSNLTLAEPDMVSFPIKWTSGVTHTLRQMMLQLHMLDSVNLRHEMDAPSIRQSLIVCTRYNEPNFFMSRSEGRGTDCGWFIGCLDKGHNHQVRENLRSISVYEAYLNQKGIQGFASFPVGSMVVMDQKKGMSIFKDGEKLAVAPGSFLDEWFKKQAKNDS